MSRLTQIYERESPPETTNYLATEHATLSEAPPATQRWNIERELEADHEETAQGILQKWSRNLAATYKNGQPVAELDHFQKAMGVFLANSEARPTDISLAKEVTELIEDKATKAEYLNRILGGDLDTEEAWSNRPFDRYWMPMESEFEWLFSRRLELSEYPVAATIDKISDEHTRALQAAATVAMLQGSLALQLAEQDTIAA